MPNTPDTSDAEGNSPLNEWERGERGQSAEHADRVSRSRETELDEMIDEALDLKMISIRLQEGLIEALKAIAERKGIGYQPLIRQILTEHVRSVAEAEAPEGEAG